LPFRNMQIEIFILNNYCFLCNGIGCISA